jgi:hypothetical protein
MNAGVVTTPVGAPPVPTPLAPVPVPARARALVPVPALVRVRVPGIETGTMTGTMVTIARVARLAGATGRLVLVSVLVLPPVVVVVTLGVSPVVGGDVVPLGPSDTRLASLTLRANGQSESVNTRSSYASGGRLLVVLSAVLLVATVAVLSFDCCPRESFIFMCMCVSDWSLSSSELRLG